ncbi:MAG: serine hydrolase [bacterium]
MRFFQDNSRGKHLIIIFVLLIFFFMFPGCQEIIDNLNHYLDSAHELWGFNGSVLISWNNRVVLNKSYGMANVEFNIPNTSHTKFFIGSLTKQFTAAAIMILEQRGLIDLHKPIKTYLPDFNHPDNNKITIHHLLTHSSGLPNYTDDIDLYFKRTKDITQEQLLKLFENEKLLFKPGTDFYYSNTGYVILGAIIEKVSGQSYEAFLHKEIFNPLGMKNSGYGRREAALPQRADGYTFYEFGQLVDALPIDFAFLHSAGALYSTVEDLQKWNKALDEGKILTKKTIKKMNIPYINNYGYGWIMESRYGYLHQYHGGQIDGYNTFMGRWPQLGLCIIVFSNDDMAPVKKIARGLAAICLSKGCEFPIKKTPIDPDPKILKEYAGLYKNDFNEYQIIYLDNDNLYIRMPGQAGMRLYSEAIDSLYYDLDNTKTIIFHRDNNSAISSMEIKDDGINIIYNNIPDSIAHKILVSRKEVTIDPSLLNRYEGRYLMESGSNIFSSNFILDITSDSNKILVQIAEGDVVELYPNSENTFFHKDNDILISFIRDERGRVTGCVITLGISETYGKRISN